MSAIPVMKSLAAGGDYTMDAKSLQILQAEELRVSRKINFYLVLALILESVILYLKLR